VDKLEWPGGIGPKLKQMLRRGVGVHHAGLLPKYRRVVEELFQKKLLSVALCTETLAAGINLPARSVVLTSLVKGPFGKEKVIDPSTAHQIFGRAGRPQFDTEGFVYALPHEDDVRIAKWKKLYDQIPETSKDPVMLRKKKDLLKKKPARNTQRKYWGLSDFERLQAAAPARLYSKGPLPWRLLAYLLKVSPDVDKLRTFIKKRLLDQPRIEAGIKQLNRMLIVLSENDYLKLDPPFVPSAPDLAVANDPNQTKTGPSTADIAAYEPKTATPTPELDKLLVFRAVHPLYGAFLIDHLAHANREERILILESVLELPRPLLKFVRIPDGLPPGPLEVEHLDPVMVARGLIVAKPPKLDGEEEEEEEFVPWDERPPKLPDKLKLLFDSLHPDVMDFTTQAVWCAGEVLHFGGNFATFITSKDLAKQEGLVFRHLLRMILLTEEFSQVTPTGLDPSAWQADLKDIADRLTETCKAVDPQSTEQTIKKAHAADVVEGEVAATIASGTEKADDFGVGILD